MRCVNMLLRDRFAFLIAVFNLPSLLAQLRPNECPNANLIKPCNCSKLEGSGSGNENIAVCDEILSRDVLTRAMKNFRGYLIQRVVIFNSNITFLPSNLFSGITVKEIHIRNTLLRSFSDGNYSAFTGVEKSLQSLLMRECRLNSEMPFELLKSLRSLKQLDLGGNALQVVKEFWFNKPSYNLSLLYLPQNEIEVIEPFAFADLDGLILLDLSENSIARLQRNMFPKKFSSLRFIYLSYNKITALPSNIFTDMPSLRNIYLDFNHIYTLDADAWSPVWAQIKILDLLGNNVTCNCGIYWMTEVNLPPRFYGECHQPHSLRGHPLNDLWPWHISEAPEMANERCSSIVTSRHSLPN